MQREIVPTGDSTPQVQHHKGTQRPGDVALSSDLSQAGAAVENRPTFVSPGRQFVGVRDQEQGGYQQNSKRQPQLVLLRLERQVSLLHYSPNCLLNWYQMVRRNRRPMTEHTVARPTRANRGKRGQTRRLQCGFATQDRRWPVRHDRMKGNVRTRSYLWNQMI